MTEQNRASETQWDRRTVVKAAAWSIPVVAAAAALPLAAASATAPQSRFGEIVNVAIGGDISLGAPLSFALVGSATAGMLITITVAGELTASTGEASQAMPYEVRSANGPNFSVVSSETSPDGTQILVLVINRDLVEGTYTKTISWAPRSGRTADEVAELVRGWGTGVYSAPTTISVGGQPGTGSVFTLTRPAV